MEPEDEIDTAPPEESREDAPRRSAGEWERARFTEEAKRRRAAEKRNAELEAKLAEHTALADRLAALEAERAAERASWEEERGLGKLGINDPDAIDVARLYWGKLPAEGRPTLPAYLEGVKGDPAKAPALLRTALGLTVEPAAEEPETKAPETPARTGAPRLTGARPPSAPASTAKPPYTGEQIRELRKEAERTNKWDALNAAVAALRASQK
jgi:hypothetical protein